MSWDKNTISCSEIDKTIELLSELSIPYSLKILGKVTGYGLNDDYAKTDQHKIRQLEYKEKVILEQMIRNDDCDSDDVIYSFKFDKQDVPKKWKVEYDIKKEISIKLKGGKDGRTNK